MLWQFLFFEFQGALFFGDEQRTHNVTQRQNLRQAGSTSRSSMVALRCLVLCAVGVSGLELVGRRALVQKGVAVAAAVTGVTAADAYSGVYGTSVSMGRSYGARSLSLYIFAYMHVSGGR